MSEAYYVIEVQPPDAPADRFEIDDDELILGRSKKRADIIVPDAQASGTHAKLCFDGVNVTLEDLKSTNGTSKDGKKLSSVVRLAANEFFLIGETIITLTDVVVPEPETVKLDSAPILDGDETMNRFLPPVEQQGSDATVAFDRASIPVGGFEESWQPEAPQPEPDAQPEDDDGEDDDTESGGGGRVVGGVIGIIALVLVVYAIVIGVLTAIPPSPGDLGLVELDEAHPTSQLMAVANVSWKFANTEYRFVSVLGSDSYENVRIHHEKAAKAYKTVLDTDADRADRREALELLMRESDYAKRGTSRLAKNLDGMRLGMYITMGVAVLAGLLIFFGLRRIGGFLMLAGVVGPLLTKQPVLIEPLIFTGILGLFAIASIVSGFLLAKRAAVSS